MGFAARVPLYKHFKSANTRSMEETPVPYTDEEIAVQVQSGDVDAFGVLVNRYEAKLLRYGRRFLSNKENIEDLVQDSFIRTYQSIKSYDPTLPFQPWIYRIAHNTFINGSKKQRRSPFAIFDFDTLLAHPTYTDPLEEEKDREEVRMRMTSALDMLPPKYKEVLILHYMEELSYKAIADILQIPIGTVGIRISRAKTVLKKEYGTTPTL